MKSLKMSKMYEYVNENTIELNRQKIKSLETINLNTLLPQNPYLLAGIKNITVVGDLIAGLLDAFLSSSEEKLFGDFLEGLAVFIAGETCSGHKSTAPGVDLEFINNKIHYVISIKSGSSWGNSSQQDKLERDLKNAIIRVKQSKKGVNVQPVLGICCVFR
jgi:hypothetical protein